MPCVPPTSGVTSAHGWCVRRYSPRVHHWLSRFVGTATQTPPRRCAADDPPRERHHRADRRGARTTTRRPPGRDPHQRTVQPGRLLPPSPDPTGDLHLRRRDRGHLSGRAARTPRLAAERAHSAAVRVTQPCGEGFTRLELMSTLSGEPLYTAYGFRPLERLGRRYRRSRRAPRPDGEAGRPEPARLTRPRRPHRFPTMGHGPTAPLSPFLQTATAARRVRVSRDHPPVTTCPVSGRKFRSSVPAGGVRPG